MSQDTLGGTARAMASAVPPVSTSAVSAHLDDNGSEVTDINSATTERLRCLPNIGIFYANRIVKGRPYAETIELVTKRILPQQTYDRIKSRLVTR